MKRQIMWKRLVSMALVASLSACGGGGGGGSTTPTTPTTPTNPVVDLPSAFGSYLSDLTDNHIVPAYTELKSRSESQLAAAQTFCSIASPTNNDLSSLRESWVLANQAWQNIQWVKLGPVARENRLFRIQFWPDTNDAVSRGVDGLLIEPDVVTAEVVASRNVGGQGLPALELLLYPTDANDSLLDASDRQKRCEVVQAIAANMVNVTGAIAEAWSISGGNYREQLVSGTGDFTSTRDAVEELVTNWFTQLELVKDEKLLIPLGVTAPGIPEIVEHVLSGESLNSVATNLASFRQLYTAGDGNGFDDILNNQLDQSSISQQMLSTLDQAIARVRQVQDQYDSLEAALADGDGRVLVNALIDDLRDIRDLISADFVQALDINIGFNANDGD